MSEQNFWGTMTLHFKSMIRAIITTSKAVVLACLTPAFAASGTAVAYADVPYIQLRASLDPFIDPNTLHYGDNIAIDFHALGSPGEEFTEGILLEQGGFDPIINPKLLYTASFFSDLSLNPLVLVLTGTIDPEDNGLGTRTFETGIFAAASRTNLEDFDDDLFSNTLYYTVHDAVPEPASWTSLVTGFGILGLAMRRRQTKINFS